MGDSESGGGGSRHAAAARGGLTRPCLLLPLQRALTQDNPPATLHPLIFAGERELKAKKEAKVAKAQRAGKPPPPTPTATRPRRRPRQIRVRKGVRVRGIKVVDAETRRAAREALAAAAAARGGGDAIEVDGGDDGEWREATPPSEGAATRMDAA
jgi:hypothetical protein